MSELTQKVYMVCEHERQLLPLTSEGWALERVFFVGKPMMAQSTRPVLMSSNNGYNNYHVAGCEEEVMGSEARFLLSRPFDFHTREQQREEQVGKLQSTERALKQEIADLQKAREREQERIDTLSKTVISHNTRADEAVQRQRKLEGDLAKVRVAIGDLKYRDIVEEKG